MSITWGRQGCCILFYAGAIWGGKILGRIVQFLRDRKCCHMIRIVSCDLAKTRVNIDSDDELLVIAAVCLVTRKTCTH